MFLYYISIKSFKYLVFFSAVEDVSCRRNGLRKQVTEAKEGPLELRRQRGRENVPGGRGWGALGLSLIHI